MDGVLVIETCMDDILVGFEFGERRWTVASARQKGCLDSEDSSCKRLFAKLRD